MQLDARTALSISDSDAESDARVEPPLCRCFGVSKAVVQSAIVRHGLRQVDEVTACTEAGGACTGCHRTIRGMLAEHHQDPTLAEPPRRRTSL